MAVRKQPGQQEVLQVASDPCVIRARPLCPLMYSSHQERERREQSRVEGGAGQIRI